MMRGTKSDERNEETHRAIRCEESVGVKEIARRQGSREYKEYNSMDKCR